MTLDGKLFLAKGALLAGSSRPNKVPVRDCCRAALVALMPAMVASPALAQQAADLEEVVVTANKREQNLSDVGSTVAVLGGDTLAKRHINTLADLAQSVPGLSFANSENGTPVLSLRGVGFIESSLAAYPTVSAYIDEAPLPFGALAVHSAYDLERVEVLKGPQGTLFGQNSTGGAINYIAAKPSNILKYGADVSYGRFNEVDSQAFVSGPVSDTLQARLTVRSERMDGWQVSNSRPDDHNGKVNNSMGRLLMNWEPTSTARFSLNINGWKDKSQPEAPQYIGYVQQNPIANPVIPTVPFSPNDPRAADWGGPTAKFKEPFGDNNFWQTALRGDVDLTEKITLTSLTSYLRYHQNQGADRDGLPYEVNDVVSKGSVDSIFQELRLSNGSSAPFRWITGANFERSNVDQSVNFRFPYTSVNQTVLDVYGYDLTEATYTNSQVLRNYAMFANGEYDVTHRITLKGGARYTNSKATATICNTDYSGDPKGTGPFIWDFSQGGAYGPFQAGDCFPGNDLGVTVNGVPPGAPGEFKDTLAEHNVSWIGGADYHVTDNSLLYANVSKGYKAGNFPTVSLTTFVQARAVTQESVTAYEVGAKTALLDNALELNSAAFYYNYKNKQLRSKVQSFFGIQDALVNVPKSDIKGFEVELTGRPLKGLVMSLGYTYLDAKIDEFVGISGAGLPADFSGTRIPFTPKHQLAADIEYQFPLLASYDGFVGGGVTVRSDTISVVGGDTNPANLVQSGDRKISGIDAYTLVDARAGIVSMDGRWRISLFGKNLTDRYYWNNVVSSSDAVARFAGLPRTYGIDVSFRN
jgi:iron complex outermembrane recepter protein